MNKGFFKAGLFACLCCGVLALVPACCWDCRKPACETQCEACPSRDREVVDQQQEVVVDEDEMMDNTK